MPNLVYTSSGFPFVKFTVIRSADVNQCFTDVANVLNSVGGITVNVLKAGSPGQVLGNNGTNAIWTSGSLSTLFNVIIGSAADVTNGVATNSTFASYTPVSGDRILVLKSYATTENVTLNVPNLVLQGQGAGSTITGTMTLNSSATDFIGRDFRMTGNITVNSSGVMMENIMFANSSTWIDNGSNNSNYFQGYQE